MKKSIRKPGLFPSCVTAPLALLQMCSSSQLIVKWGGTTLNYLERVLLFTSVGELSIR